MEGNADTTAPQKAERIARLAWHFAFVVPLILAMLLLGIKSAQAASPFPAVVPLAFEEEELEAGLEEEVEGEFAEAECEIATEELEEGLLTESDVKELCTPADEATGGAAKGATECPIRSIRAHAVQRNERLKLTIGYTANDPVKATFSVRKVGTFKRRLGRSGVIRITKKLGKKQLKRVVVRVTASSCTGTQASSAKVR